ncbi:MAG TPA: radical SAM family heme chaperone HemW [Micropepsaceae bacterium]|jgi:oxygen-independent coproporphyrinogen-3 oxidase|nr:radical SAM family heme chaperone HemW [Micropepsaceae bacterium]
MTAFAVYVHWPFCAAKCPYCDFNSHVRERYDEARWARAIAKELGAVAALQGATRPEVGSIFFGGGTPSLMSGAAVGTVLDAIGGLWPVSPAAEITLEANPNSVEQGRFRDYHAAGVNRVSIGVQALDESALKALGRLHGVEEAREAIRLGLSVFPRVSFDLIYARPGQSDEAWTTELKDALSYGTEHLSLYQLTIEPGTAYATLARQGKLIVPNEDRAADLYEITQEFCDSAGLTVYEVSNHARPGAESRHNLTYWRYGDYAGVGPGSHGRLSIAERGLATQAERLPERWLTEVEEKSSSLVLTELSREESARENLLMSVRLSEGLDLNAYRSRWGVAPSPSVVVSLQAAGLVMMENGRLAATPAGRLVLNGVIRELADSLQPQWPG